MLDDVMVYWVTNSGASSARLYWESFGKMTPGKVDVPTGVAAFPKEIIKAPRNWCEARYHVTHWTDMPRGGHFAAFEQPELFVDDVRKFFGSCAPERD
jgi:pimeloyl-ACP methyl ester carboxylesterase